MRILVVGAGQVGHAVTAALHTGHEITIVDLDDALLADLVNRYDVMSVAGNGTSDLLNVGASNARTFTVDTTAPKPSVTTPANNSATNDTTPTITGTAGYATGDVLTVVVRIFAGSGGSVDATAAWTSGDVEVNATTGAAGQRIDWDSATTAPSTPPPSTPSRASHDPMKPLPLCHARLAPIGGSVTLARRRPTARRRAGTAKIIQATRCLSN